MDDRTLPLPPVRPAQVVLPPRRPSRHGNEFLRGLSPAQVICWQVAVFGVLAAPRQPWTVLVAAVVGAVIVLVLTGIRVGGRWLYELPGIGIGYLLRPRRGKSLAAGDTVALLATLVPGATVRTVETNRGPAMAVSHRDGMTALLAPGACTPDLVGRLPTPSALLPVSADQLFGVQLVLHVGTRPDGPRRVWVAVHAGRTVETPGDDELTLVLRNGMRRVRRALDRAGVPVRPLAGRPALDAIAGLAHITGGHTEIREDWRYWRAGPICHATYRLGGGDRLAEGRALVGALLAGIPGVATTITLAAHTERRGGVLRLAAPSPAAVERAAGRVTGLLAAAGVRMTRLDGAQLSGIAASLPIGVFR